MRFWEGCRTYLFNQVKSFLTDLQVQDTPGGNKRMYNKNIFVTSIKRHFIALNSFKSF